MGAPKGRSLNASRGLTADESGVGRVGPYTWDEFVERVLSFHTYAAPGVLVGGIMVDMAREQIPEGVLFNVVCETHSCLPDAVQILTPCTAGNGWLRVVNLGRYAVVLYDKHKGEGFRVYLDPRKLDEWDEIRAWYLKLKTKREQDGDRLREEIRRAGRRVCTLHPVRVRTGDVIRRSKGAIGICGACGEAYPVKDGPVCLGCQGQAPYEMPVANKT